MFSLFSGEVPIKGIFYLDRTPKGNLFVCVPGFTHIRLTDVLVNLNQSFYREGTQGLHFLINFGFRVKGINRLSGSLRTVTPVSPRFYGGEYFLLGLLPSTGSKV